MGPATRAGFDLRRWRVRALGYGDVFPRAAPTPEQTLCGAILNPLLTNRDLSRFIPLRTLPDWDKVYSVFPPVSF